MISRNGTFTHTTIQKDSTTGGSLDLATSWDEMGGFDIDWSKFYFGSNYSKGFKGDAE